MLDVKQLDFYDLNGYLSVEGVFSKTQIDALSDVTDQFVEKSRLVIEEDDIFGLESDHSSENEWASGIWFPSSASLIDSPRSTAPPCRNHS